MRMDRLKTPERVVEAAIEVFLEKGYEAATVRTICRRAKANVAAVNYHFGSKDGLRAAVLENILEQVNARTPIGAGLDPSAPAQERLRRFVRNILAQAYPEDPELERRSSLFWMEMANPSPALAPLVERYMRPIKDILEAIIRELAGPADPETIRLCAASIAGQCLFDCQNRAVVAHLYPDAPSLPRDVRHMADVVTTFALAGLEAVRLRHGTPL